MEGVQHPLVKKVVVDLSAVGQSCVCCHPLVRLPSDSNNLKLYINVISAPLLSISDQKGRWSDC